MNQETLNNIKKIMEENLTVKTTYNLEYDVVDQIISTFFNIDYEITAEEELFNDSIFSLSVYSNNVTSYDLNNISAIKNGKTTQYSTGIYMSYLAKEGLIPEGEYIINVSW